MHIGVNELAHLPLGAGLYPDVGSSTGAAEMIFGGHLVLEIVTNSILWYDACSGVDYDIEWQDIVIEVTPNIGVTTE